MAMTQEPIFWRCLHVSTIYKAYFSGLCLREYPRKIWPEKWYSTSILGSWNSHWLVVEPPLRKIWKSVFHFPVACQSLLACFLHQLCTPSTLHIIFSQLGLLFLYGKIKFMFQTTNQKCIKHQGFHKWGYPNSWMVDFMENPNLKWFKMDDLGMLPFMESLKYIQIIVWHTAKPPIVLPSLTYKTFVTLVNVV